MTSDNQNQHIPIEDLSAYADGEALSDAERVAIEEHLSGCPECREELASLQQVAALLADLPEPEVPRSFRLSPEDVGIPQFESPDPIPLQPWIVRQQSRFRWAGLAAAALLLMVITADLFSGTSSDEATDFTLMQDTVEEPAPAEDERTDSPGIMSIEEEAAEEPATEEAAPDADLDAVAPAEDAPDTVEESAPAEAPEDQPVSEIAPDDVAGTDDPDHPVADSAADDDMAMMHQAEDPDTGLSLLQWTGIILAVLTVALLVAGFVLPRVWNPASRTPR